MPNALGRADHDTNNGRLEWFALRNFSLASRPWSQFILKELLETLLWLISSFIDKETGSRKDKGWCSVNPQGSGTPAQLLGSWPCRATPKLTEWCSPNTPSLQAAAISRARLYHYCADGEYPDLHLSPKLGKAVVYVNYSHLIILGDGREADLYQA